MEGFVFRFVVRLKDWGERLKLAWLTGLGLKIKDWGMKHGKV